MPDWIEREVEKALRDALSEGELSYNEKEAMPRWAVPYTHPDEEANLIYTAGEEAEAPPPEDVRLHFRDGSEQKVELVYLGVRPDGMRIWKVTTKPRFPDVESVTIEAMPSMTMIQVESHDGP